MYTYVQLLRYCDNTKYFYFIYFLNVKSTSHYIAEGNALLNIRNNSGEKSIHIVYLS